MADSDTESQSYVDNLYLPPGRLENIEREPLETEGWEDVQEEDLTDIEIADLLYTRDWTSVDTPEKADAFVAMLLKDASENELLYISNIYHGKDNTETARNIIQDRIDDIDKLLNEQQLPQPLSADDITDTWVSQIINSKITLQNNHDEECSDQELRDKYEPESIEVTGGGKGGDDYELYKLLQYADSVHDFDPMPPAKEKTVVEKYKIRQSMNVDVPVDLVDRDDLKEDEIDDISNKFEFVKYITARKSISFTNKEVSNDALVGKDINYQFNINKAYQLQKLGLWDLFRLQERLHKRQNGMLSVDVWCPRHPSQKRRTPLGKPGKLYKDIVRMAQITSLCTKMKQYFGNGKLTFIVDASDDQVVRMILATSVIDLAIGRRFVVVDATDDEMTRMMTVATPAVGIVDTNNKEKAKLDWSYEICDANLFDGATHIDSDTRKYKDPILSRKATGDVYRSCPDRPDEVQVMLDGIHGPDKNPTVKYVINGGSEQSDLHSAKKYSCKNMAAIMNNEWEKGRFNINEYLACKRAGDWGQVEHCKKNDYIFVTSDVLATLYAVYRGVKVLSLNRNVDEIAVPEPMPFLQCTFTMFKPVQEGGKKNVHKLAL